MHRSTHKAPKSARIVILNILAEWSVADPSNSTLPALPHQLSRCQKRQKWQRPLSAGRKYRLTANYSMNRFKIYLTETVTNATTVLKTSKAELPPITGLIYLVCVTDTPSQIKIVIIIWVQKTKQETGIKRWHILSSNNMQMEWRHIAYNKKINFINIHAICYQNCVCV